MSEKKQRLRRGDARVEYLANRDECISLLEKGYSLARALEILNQAGKMKISYCSLRKYFNGENELEPRVLKEYRERERMRKEKEKNCLESPVFSVEEKPKTSPVALAQPSPVQSTPRILSSPTNKFPRPSDIDVNDAL